MAIHNQTAVARAIAVIATTMLRNVVAAVVKKYADDNY